MSYLKHKPGSIEEMMANNAKKLNDNAYQDMFKKELEKAGKGIGSMSPKEKKDFFNKIDDKYKAKNEKVDNPYAVGMAAAMKAKDDKPPLKKSTITKAHDIAKSIKKDEKNEEKDVPKGYHKMPDGTIMKDSEHKKEELNKDDTSAVKKVKDMLTKASQAHAGQAKELDKAMKNEADEKGDEINKKKLAMVKKGEKDIVDPKPKMSFKEAYKKAKKEAMNTVGDATADQANQRVGEGPKENDPDIKKPKAKADTGSKATPVDTSPEVEYKN